MTAVCKTFLPGKRTLKRLAAGLAAAALACAAAWVAAPFLVEDPMPGVLARTPVRTWCDRDGRPLYCERTWQYEWRFDVPLSEIPPAVVETMLAVEDSRFYSHGGIDYRSLARAFLQDILAMRVVSGASTISMQTAAMDYHAGRRSLFQKFVQMAKARKMERLHTKAEILEAYFNNLPFGGNIYGIEAAARFYFGMSARDLGVEEASILCGLPQLPNRLRPDRHPEAARRRQAIVLARLARCGVIDEDEAARIRDGRMRYRDFSQPAEFERLGSPREWGFVMPATGPMRHGDPQTVRLEVDSELTRRVRDALARRAESAERVRDAAAVVIDVATGEKVAYVGTLDFDSPHGGQIDAARATRSVGSALKPFIYAEAMRGGLLVARSPVTDAPVRYGDYRPENADGGYAGRTSAAFALSRSLNIPAIRLVAELGVGRVAGMLGSLGLGAGGQVATNGLSIALGTAGYRLDRMTAAYATLAPRLGDPGAGQFSGEDDLRAMLGEMLRSLPLPGTTLPVAWKTGTSNNNCDAWCFGYTADYAVGVWFGNKDGSRSDALAGVSIAAPAVGEIFEILYARRPHPVWPFTPDHSAEARLCASSGRLASPSCGEAISGRVLKRIPLALCESCGRPARKIAIVSPAPLDYIIADSSDTLTLRLDSGATEATWFVDGTMLPQGTRSFGFPPGRHTVTAIPAEISLASAQVELTVRK